MKTVSRFRFLMRTLAVMYALGAVVFFFFPTELIYLINVGPKVFKLTEAMPDPVDRYWTVLASSGLAMLSALSLFSAESPGVRGYTLVHLLAKTVTIAGFIYMFLNEKHYFAYVLGVSADAGLVLLILWHSLGTRKNPA